MKILVVIPKEINGVTYHRLLVPFRKIAQELNVTQVYNIDNVTPFQLKQFDVVIMSRLEGSYDVEGNINKLKAFDIPYILDIDDYWQLSMDHLMKKRYDKNNVPEKITKYIKGAAQVWTTQKYFAEVIYKINKNVVVIPNAIDFTESQWLNTEKSDREKYTFGWVGGIHHFEDLTLIKQALSRINELDCGIAMGGHVSNDIVWNIFEDWFMNYGKNKNYYRMEARDINSYAHLYDHIDCALIPLKDNKFNNCKSELKVIEAAMKLKPVIVSNVIPYTNICNESNSYLIDERKGHKAWFKAMQLILSNPYEACDKAIQLRKDVNEKYNLETINNLRIESMNSLFFEFKRKSNPMVENELSSPNIVAV